MSKTTTEWAIEVRLTPDSAWSRYDARYSTQALTESVALNVVGRVIDRAINVLNRQSDVLLDGLIDALPLTTDVRVVKLTITCVEEPQEPERYADLLVRAELAKTDLAEERE